MAEAIISVVLEQLAFIITEMKLLDGVKKEIQSLSRTLRTIQAGINDAEQKQVTSEVVRLWLQNLKEVVYEIENLLDEWSTKLLRSRIKALFRKHDRGIKFLIRSISPYKSLVQRHIIGHGIKEIRERLEAIARDRYNFHLNESSALERPQQEITSSVVDLTEICGRDDEKEVLLSKLLSEGSSQIEETTPIIICIVGMGGLGKTNISQCLFNEPKIKDQFENRIWVCVSDPFDKEKVAKAIIEGIGGSASVAFQWDALHRCLCDVLKNKRVLLVLDDVWTEKHAEWEPIKLALNGGAPGMKILVTTRSERVAEMMNATYTHPLGVLPLEDCWSLFSRIAFAGRGEEERLMLRDTGRKMVEKCKGVPLYVKTLAGAMRFKRSEDWEDVLKSDTWEIQEVVQGVLPALLLSYYSLPPNLKRCFEFCAFFPKDYKLEKDKLIKLWMAHGFLKSNQGGGSTEMEKTGEDYFDNLVMRSLLQDVEEDEDSIYLISSSITCKMHDLVHDLARFLTSNESFKIERNSASEINAYKFEKVSGNFHHQMIELTVVPDEGVKRFLYNEIKRKKHLRTLKLQSYFTLSAVSPKLVCHLTCLRALDLSQTRIESLPNEVENLIHLRYLDLSGTYLKKLPKTLSKLCNLQTLRLNDCYFLEELPLGIGKMISLRHIENLGSHSLRCMPEGMGQLSNLCTLQSFIVSDGSKSESCALKELKHLNLLRRVLLIIGLEKVVNFDEAKEANMMKKEHLSRVFFWFKSNLSDVSDDSCHSNLSEVPKNKKRDVGEGEMERLDSVLEGLQLHPNVKRLDISRYHGSKFPSWMMDTSSILMYSQLQHLYLEECINCTELPPLGKLQSLETLEISGMESIKHIGQEFWGISDITDQWESSTSTRRGSPSSSSREGRECTVNGDVEPAAVIVFPKLKKLCFQTMMEWEDWEVLPQPTIREESNKEAIGGGESEEIITMNTTTTTSTTTMSAVRIIMPCLKSLSLDYCPKLKSIPLNISSQTPWTLEIRWCPVLTQNPIPTKGMAQLQELRDSFEDEADSFDSLRMMPKYMRRRLQNIR